MGAFLPCCILTVLIVVNVVSCGGIATALCKTQVYNSLHNAVYVAGLTDGD